MKDIVISTPSVQSVIHCGQGALDAYARQLADSRPFIVTDANVFGLYRETVKKYFPSSYVHVIPAGEKNKNYGRLLEILKAMIGNGVTRSSTVVALGGGVVGDITGLAASLYMRGVRLVQIPTTLLSQVDSSVGGKTAVDFCGVKNVIGTFYQPSEVIVDPLFLSTLPKRETRCGLGEIVKYGALDREIYRRLLKNKSHLFSEKFLEEITFSCIEHKAKIVTDDEKDLNGLRKTLNLGHTTGHAFELYYKRKSHGEFVLIGMYYELYLAEKRGVCGGEYAENLKKLIKKVVGKIPAYEDAERAALMAKYDKKNEKTDVVSVVVPCEEGRSAELKLPLDEYAAAIGECRDFLKERL